MTFARSGFAHFPAAIGSAITELERLLQPYGDTRTGRRITGDTELECFLSPAEVLSPVFKQLSENTRPVRAILFDKRADRNWSLGWHQDRTICVRGQAVVEGFGPFSRKQGILHVEPPFALLEHMVTLRLHLDPVPETNAPLLVAKGTHLLGKVADSDTAAVALAHPRHVCLAQRGDVWAYATPILHASHAKKHTVGPEARRRRVLQVDYSPDTLPPPLDWLGIG